MADAANTITGEVRPSRRTLFGAAAAAAALPSLAIAAPEPDLAARYRALRESYNALPLDTPRDVDDALYYQFMRLDDEIVERPCLTPADARAKVAHAIRGLEDGERGTEIDALEQVLAFLGAK